MAVFKNMYEVNLFMWVWQKYINQWFKAHVQAARTTAHNLLGLTAEVIDDFFRVMDPWTNQIVRFATTQWNTVLRKLAPPLVTAFRKLNDIRTEVWPGVFTAIEKVAYAGEGAIRFVTEPLTQIVDRIRGALLGLAGIARAIAYQVQVELFGTEGRTFDSTGAVAEQIDELSSWLDHLLDEDGLLQPRILLQSTWVYMGGLVALLVNGGIFGDPKKLFAELLELFPFPDGSTILAELREGRMAKEETIQKALETFNRFI